jgi:hypothetical protein
MITFSRPSKSGDSSINIIHSKEGIVDRIISTGEKWYIRSFPDIFFEALDEALNAYTEHNELPYRAVYMILDKHNQTPKVFEEQGTSNNWRSIEDANFALNEYLKSNPNAYLYPDLVLINVNENSIYQFQETSLVAA